jgi:rod shape-determining protein MreC
VARTRTTSRRARRPTWTIAILVLASITIITLDYRGNLHGGFTSLRRGTHDLFTPVQRGVDGVLRPVGDFFAGAIHYRSVQEQNAVLRAENGRYQREALAHQSQLNQLQQVLRLTHLPWIGSIPYVTGQVTDVSPSDFASTVDLSVGTADGVAKGMSVVGGAGLVGLVTEVWTHGCTVQLINDQSSAVSVRYGTGGATALVSGRGDDSPLEVDYVPLGTMLAKGTVLTSSGLQHDLFPPGIPVARVRSSTASSSAAFETVQADPLADLSNLQWVDVIQWLPPPVPAGS